MRKYIYNLHILTAFSDLGVEVKRQNVPSVLGSGLILYISPGHHAEAF